MQNCHQHDETIVDQATEFSDTIVVTGGEPLMWDIDPLTSLLKQKTLKAHIETSGAYPLTGDWDWICLSPKKRKLPISEVYSKANELKVIVYNKDDFKFAEEQAAKVAQDCILYLQPEWSVRKKNNTFYSRIRHEAPKMENFFTNTHKYLNIP